MLLEGQRCFQVVGNQLLILGSTKPFLLDHRFKSYRSKCAARPYHAERTGSTHTIFVSGDQSVVTVLISLISDARVMYSFPY